LVQKDMARGQRMCDRLVITPTKPGGEGKSYGSVKQSLGTVKPSQRLSWLVDTMSRCLNRRPAMAGWPEKQTPGVTPRIG
jgi:hypothetical protein